MLHLPNVARSGRNPRTPLHLPPTRKATEVNTHHTAALAVCAHATSTEDARELLTMLGLIDGGQLTDPDIREYLFDGLTDVAPPQPEARHSLSTTRHVTVDRTGWTTPAGLRHLAPIAAPVRPRAPRSVAQMKGPPQDSNEANLAPCTTKHARARHKRRGEDCKVCADDLITRGFNKGWFKQTAESP